MGTLYKNGIPYGGGGGGDNSKTVTYEQYKILSEAEKNSDTTYYVPDYPGTESLSGSDVVDNLESTATDLPLSANMGRELSETTAKISDFENIMSVTSEYGTVTGGYIKIGKQVSINIKLNITKNITSNVSDVIKGLPHVLNSYTGIVCFNVNTGVNLEAYIVSGTIRIVTANSVYIASGQAVTISGCYLAT